MQTMLRSPVMVRPKSVRDVLQVDEESRTRPRRGSAYDAYDPQARLNGPTPQRIPMPKSLGEVLQNPIQRHKFREYLKEMHAVESLLFYESVELYAKIEDPKWSKTAALDIVKKFISPNGAYEINISSATREALMTNKKWARNAFDEAKAEAYLLLKMNFFAAFLAREYLSDST